MPAWNARLAPYAAGFAAALTWLLIGVAPDLVFSGFGIHRGAPRYARNESPAQRVGQWISMHLVEPLFAFDDPDFALATVLKRQTWPARPGKTWNTAVRKLAVTSPDRNTHIWAKVENDPAYKAIARGIWAEEFVPSEDDPPPEQAKATTKEQIDRMVKAVATLRARGVKVLFLRPPSDGPFLEHENKHFPRKDTWDVLLAATGAPGIHFEDYPELQGLELPEWSHLTFADARRFTAAVHAIVVRDFWPREVVDTN